MMRSFLLFSVAIAGWGDCPARCNCVKGLHGFGNIFFDKCVSCHGEWKSKWYGDKCELPCQEYKDMDNQTPRGYLGKGNCDGCDFEGNCRDCKAGWWNNNDDCHSACPANCMEPSTGENRCSDAGKCYGCMPGKCNFGSDCALDCPENCLDHKSCSAAACGCTACKDTFWGEDCDRSCLEKGTLQCDKSNGRALVCKQGYYSIAQGCLKCNANCFQEECNEDGTCKLGCANDAFFGDFCETPCPAGCDSGKCKKDDGSCACEEGLHGPTCEDKCASGCDGESCDQRTGECECKRGFWGQNCLPGRPCTGECDLACNEHCHDNKCAKEDSSCECSNGFWGRTCDQQCSEGCLTGKCDQDTGSCEDCKKGYWGSKCEFGCDDHCRDGKCKQEDGFCKCTQGRWGLGSEGPKNVDGRTEQCTQECPHCKKDLPLNTWGNPRSRCKQGDGKCYDCDKGKWGRDCSKECAKKCIDGECDRDDGTCTCQTGFWGERACQPCPAACTSFCDGLTGECVDGCQPGKWGKEAGKNCANDCPEHCSNGGVCDWETGVCAGCVKGWYGKNCDQACSPNTNDGMGCHQVSGHSDACKLGWFGDMCDKVCPAHCTGGSDGNPGKCEQHPLEANPNGECYACVDQKYWKPDCSALCSEHCTDGKCDQMGMCFSCDEGWFGDMCDERCPAKCVGGCNRMTGVCNACPAGWYGDSCSEMCHARCYECTGGGHDMCLSCDDAAELCLPGGTNWLGQHTCTHPGINEVGKCKCLDHASRYEGGKALIVLDQIVKRNEKCYCDTEDSSGLHWARGPNGAFDKCWRACPRFMAESLGKCFPTEVRDVLKRGGVSAGRCPDKSRKPQYQIDFNPPLCLDMESAMLIYNMDPSVLPAPASSSNPLPSALCDTEDENGQKQAKITSMCLGDDYKKWIIKKPTVGQDGKPVIFA